MYAAFNKNTQTISLSYPVVLSDQGTFQGQTNDTVTAPSYTWSNDTNTGFYHPQSDHIGFVTNGVERMRLIADGNIGIGTTSPFGRFQVAGTSTTFTVTNGGNVGLGTLSPVSGFSMQSAGYSLLPLPTAILEERYSSGSSTIAYADGTAVNTSVAAPSGVTNVNTWRVRRLNTFTYPNVGDFVRSFVTLDVANFYFTLGAGTYYIQAEGTGISVGKHRIALTSSSGVAVTSTPTIVLAGTSEITNPVAATNIKDFLNNISSSVANLSISKSVLSGFFTVTDPTLRYRIQHFTNQNDSTGAFGCPAVSGTDDIYLRVVLTRYQ